MPHSAEEVQQRWHAPCTSAHVGAFSAPHSLPALPCPQRMQVLPQHPDPQRSTRPEDAHHPVLLIRFVQSLLTDRMKAARFIPVKLALNPVLSPACTRSIAVLGTSLWFLPADVLSSRFLILWPWRSNYGSGRQRPFCCPLAPCRTEPPQYLFTAGPQPPIRPFLPISPADSSGFHVLCSITPDSIRLVPYRP